MWCIWANSYVVSVFPSTTGAAISAIFVSTAIVVSVLLAFDSVLLLMVALAIALLAAAAADAAADDPFCAWMIKNDKMK